MKGKVVKNDEIMYIPNYEKIKTIKRKFEVYQSVYKTIWASEKFRF